ncbi:phospholipase SGR2 isoform X2 [Vigna radiata var. radiata]|uniref:Phospholipase SGR2 isoform X2 n=1 Tax=Vigna radiata var. radiata TaxID=3916 RepID=A0A1S3TJB0_VIGRR|nr:phospholipase SGR2 isoform X2 [Vigna radiata var. radiata]
MAEGEEIRPDLLKNTPSNIARLEDVIEHSKARQKYLAQTCSPSDGGDVRWYFCKIPLAPNELAASVPRTEIVGKSDYFRFGMRDSLAIEASFLQREEELLSSWWREYAECSEGPRERQSSTTKSDTGSFLGRSEPSQLYEIEEERVGVPVKGGLYEVDLVSRHCFPVYWNGENRRVLRGHWFARKGGLDWLPLREDVSEQLEIAYRSQVWHRRTFQPSGLFAARVDLQGSTQGLHALFTGEDDTWEAWLNIDASGFSSFVSFTGNAIKLRRGYSPSNSPKPTQDELRQQKEEAMDDYCSQVPVRHLVFMVHGIGQRLEKSNLVDDVGNFRHITASLAEQHLTAHQRGTQRVLFIPCQWRKGLKLSGETAVEKITLDGVRGLRVTLSATVHDVLYYMSPIYCQDIIDSVSNQLNRLYLKFLKRNPGYNGKVSLYGHSLGSVLSYDILCHQDNLSSPFPMEWMYKEHDQNEKSLPNKEYNNVQNSLINPDDTFSMVSPSEENKGTQHTSPDMEAEYCEESSVLGPELSSVREFSAEPSFVEPNNKGDVSEFLSDSSYTNVEKMDALDEPESMNVGLPADTDECKVARNKDEVINKLREEIDSLKAELESRHSINQTEEELHSVQKLSKKSPAIQDAPKSYTPYIKYTKLQFEVDTFFAVGSPLGVFLALRNIRIGIGKGQEYWEQENIREEMPACRQLFNIFHPYDPVAYRIEPLVCKEYISQRPVLIPYHRGGKRLHIGFQEFTEDLAVRTHSVKNYMISARDKVITLCQSRKFDNSEGESSEEEEETSYGSFMIERLTGSKSGRIDHMLQDKTFEHPYLQAIGAHTNYWRDYDTALFILKHLYRDTPEDQDIIEDPDLSIVSSMDKSKQESTSVGWYEPRDTIEEDLPLTFSDKVMVRSFSSKAKKVLQKHTAPNY